jgi:hypothetical protein
MTHVSRIWPKMCGALAIGTIVFGAATSMQAATTLYQETFPAGADGSNTLADVGWNTDTVNNVSWHSIETSANDQGDGTFELDDDGKYNQWHGIDTEQNPSAVVTMEPDIDPTLYPGVTFEWHQQATFSGSDVDARLAIEVGNQWYTSNQVFSNGSQWETQLKELEYDPAQGNWLTLDRSTDSPSVGTSPGSALSGNITGLGFFTVEQADGDLKGGMAFDNVAVTAVPSPSSAAALLLGSVVLFKRRRMGERSESQAG